MNICLINVCLWFDFLLVPLGFSQKKIIDFFRIQKSKGAIHKYPSSPQGKLEFIDLNIFDLKYLHEKGEFIPKAQCDQCLEVIIWFVTKTVRFKHTRTQEGG